MMVFATATAVCWREKEKKKKKRIGIVDAWHAEDTAVCDQYNSSD